MSDSKIPSIPPDAKKTLGQVGGGLSLAGLLLWAVLNEGADMRDKMQEVVVELRVMNEQLKGHVVASDKEHRDARKERDRAAHERADLDQRLDEAEKSLSQPRRRRR